MGPDETHGGEPILIVAAHPDDETVGAGARLQRWRDSVHLVHATDGAPRNPMDARNAGCSTREEYAAMRRRELLNALALSGIGPNRCRWAGVADQEASLHIGPLTRFVLDTIREVRPAAMITHPYEGGHPDHDACAFAVHTAARRHGGGVAIWEFTSYHAGPQGFQMGRFLPNSPNPPITYRLSEAERKHKSAMFECFASQLHMLKHFGLEEEAFRRAPAYDFTQPPHEGTLLYENFEWGMTGARWRELATSTLREWE